MKLFDLHCDTLLELYETGQDINHNDLHISLNRAAAYEKYVQVLAVYSEHKQSEEENYRQFFSVLENFRKMSLPENFEYILAVEGGKLLAGDIARLDRLYDEGVRFLTLVWGGECCIGGAHDTGLGLTDFGRRTVGRCFELGIVPDISHASDRLFWDTFELAEKRGKPIVATHSNSRAVTLHSRNLTDEMFRSVRDSGGVVGLNMVDRFLTDSGSASVDDMVRHLEHFLELDGEDTVALGCDLDGTKPLPDGVAGIGDVCALALRLEQLGYVKELIEKLFYGNAAAFAARELAL